MIMLWVMHFASYLINRHSFNTKVFDDNFNDNHQKDYYRRDNEACSSVYRPAMEQFKTTKSLWVVQGVVYLYVISVYWKHHGSQMIVDLWVPLDFSIFISMGIYAYICLRRIKN